MSYDLFIKMILALPPEIFQDWKWKEGDRFLSEIDDEWTIHSIGDYCLEDGVVGRWFPVFGGDFGFFWNGDLMFPVPSQKQLQVLSGLDWDLYYHDLLKRYSEYDTAEEAGLAMIMYTKYQQKWDGEKWV